MKLIFKAKPQQNYTRYDSELNERHYNNVVFLPKTIKKSHCVDEHTTNCDRFFNSDILTQIVKRELNGLRFIDLDNLPANVSVSGKFIVTVTISGI
jgi:hypothetical protein